MEKQPNPEKQKPLKDDCMHCGKRYKLTPENTAIIEYTQKAECNFVHCQCPNCEGITRIFIPPNSPTIDILKSQSVRVGQLEWPSDDIYNSWCEVNGIELLRPQEITPRQEKLIDFMHYLFENGNLEAELLQGDN